MSSHNNSSEDRHLEMKSLDTQSWNELQETSGLLLGLRPAKERRRYKVTPSLIGWAQT